MTSTTVRTKSSLAALADAQLADLAAKTRTLGPPGRMFGISSGDQAVAWALLRRALDRHPEFSNALVRKSCLLLLELPSKEWIDPVEHVLRLYIAQKSGQACTEPEGSSADGVERDDVDDNLFGRATESCHEPGCVLDSKVAKGFSDWSSLTSGSLPQALAQGDAVIILTTKLFPPPPSVRLMAECCISLPGIDNAILSEAAVALLGEQPTVVVEDSLCRLLTQDALRLSLRHQETANGWLQRLRQFCAETSKSRPKSPTLHDLHGMDEARSWGIDLVVDLKDFQTGRIGWSDVDRGCLLVGPPGTGKTTFANRLAATANLPLITGSHSEWQAAGHQGDMLAAMRRTFAGALAAAPCILFIDEIDAFGNRATLRSHQRDYSVQVVNALLELTDGTLGREGVVLIAAANSRDVDPALIRPGRLDRVISIPLPDDRSLAQILRCQLGDDNLAGVDLVPLVARLNASGADTEQWIRGARRLARRSGRAMIVEDLVAQIPRVPTPSGELGWRIAIHEAGHAIVAEVEFPDQIREVSVVGFEPGVAMERIPALCEEDVRAKIRVLLAGRASEELRLGEPGLGCGGAVHSDLARATNLAAALYAGFGVGGHLVWMGDVQLERTSMLLSRNPDTVCWVRKLLDEEYSKTISLLSPRMSLIDQIAQELMSKGALQGADIARSVSGYKVKHQPEAVHRG